MVPYAPGVTAAELAACFAPVDILVVARAALGTINHTTLTVLELRRRGLPVAGVVLNRVRAETDPSEAHNAREIETLADVAVLGTLAHQPRLDDDEALADAVERALDLDALLRALPLTRPDVA
jgi:dethiobiotin synthetase